jgi:flagellar hook-length control protein FliK
MPAVVLDDDAGAAVDALLKKLPVTTAPKLPVTQPGVADGTKKPSPDAMPVVLLPKIASMPERPEIRSSNPGSKGPNTSIDHALIHQKLRTSASNGEVPVAIAPVLDATLLDGGSDPLYAPKEKLSDPMPVPVAVPDKQEPVTSSTRPEPVLSRQDLHNVVKEVANRLEMLAATRSREGVTIHLNPEHLGQITVVLRTVGKDLGAELFASNDNVRKALHENQTQLAQAMESKGYSVTTVNVASQTAHAPTQGDAQTRHGFEQPGHHGHGHSSKHHHYSSQETAVSYGHHHRAASADGVDIWI